MRRTLGRRRGRAQRGADHSLGRGEGIDVPTVGARCVEVALDPEDTATLIEVHGQHARPLRVGQLVGVKPEQYRLYRTVS